MLIPPYNRVTTFAPMQVMVSTLMICLATVASAQKVTLTQFERDQKQVAEHVDNIVDAEFEHLERALESLQEPLAVGDSVSVAIRRGGATETVKGRFNGIVGNYLRISSNNILLSDVAEEQRDRFVIAQFPKRRDEVIAERRQAIEEAKERQRRKLRPTILRESGYGPDFFSTNLRIGDQIIPKTSLGGDNVYAVLIAIEGEDQMFCRVLNRASVQASVVAVLGGRGIGTSATPDKPGAAWGKEFTFYFPRARFSNLTQFVSTLSLVCYDDRLGAWTLAAQPQTKRKTTVTQRQGVPVKVNQIMISFALKGFARGDMLKGELATIESVPQQQFRRSVAEATVFQQDLATAREAAKAQALRDAEALAKQQAELAAAAAAEAAIGQTPDLTELPRADLKLDVVKPLVLQLANAGIAISPHPEDVASKAGEISNVPVGNHLAPHTVDGVAVFGGTDWQRLTTRSPEGSKALDFAQYRVLVGNRAEEPVTILQVTGLFASGMAASAIFNVQTTVVHDGEELPLSTSIETPIDYVGKTHLYYPIPVDLAKSSIEDAEISIQRKDP